MPLLETQSLIMWCHAAYNRFLRTQRTQSTIPDLFCKRRLHLHCLVARLEQNPPRQSGGTGKGFCEAGRVSETDVLSATLSNSSIHTNTKQKIASLRMTHQNSGTSTSTGSNTDFGLTCESCGAGVMRMVTMLHSLAKNF